MKKTEERKEKQRLENLELKCFENRLNECKTEEEVDELLEFELYTGPKYKI